MACIQHTLQCHAGYVDDNSSLAACLDAAHQANMACTVDASGGRLPTRHMTCFFAPAASQVCVSDCRCSCAVFSTLARVPHTVLCVAACVLVGISLIMRYVHEGALQCEPVCSVWLQHLSTAQCANTHECALGRQYMYAAHGKTAVNGWMSS